MDHKIKKLTRKDVQALRDAHGTATRDRASELLGGDPIQAELVTQRLFRSLIGMPVGLSAVGPLRRWIAREVVSLCLEQTGNTAVADWETYRWRHPDEKPKKKPVARALVAPSNVIPLRQPAETAPVTRHAREQLQAREEKAVTPCAGVEADAPDVPRS